MRSCLWGKKERTVCGVKGLVALFPVVLGESPRKTAENPGVSATGTDDLRRQQGTGGLSDS